ncbi:FecCD family ABC transporter permease [Peribacillus alkalitolerans]|uniref:FecCD family ABC transporter permease n=1 Tax=Peribacillus alkalitolerans TaxID=1550385 RepID=UPI0013D5EA84|nr:iron ABC transporter permease [Peribacillus alkalitolerans]
MSGRKYKSLRVGQNLSLLIDKKALLVFCILFLITAGFMIISAAVGQLYIAPMDVVRAIAGTGNEMHQTVVNTFRLPRILIALLVGISLAVAGGILQGIIKNPLASPDIIGLTGGASVAVVAFLAMFSDKNHSLTVSISWLPLAAFVGASVTTFIVYMLAWKNGVSPIRLVLVGIGISALMQAGTTMMMIMGPIYQASQANIWITGTVNGSKWADVQILLPLVILLLLLAFIFSRNLNVQELGEEIAISVGSKVQTQRLILIATATALTGGAVAFAGGIGFVGLMAPHIARRLVGSAFGALLPVSALIGGLLVIIADLIGRMMFAPLEIPAGVFTASIGAPYFIYLLYKTRNS